jgi:hypothetical protein
VYLIADDMAAQDLTPIAMTPIATLAGPIGENKDVRFRSSTCRFVLQSRQTLAIKYHVAGYLYEEAPYVRRSSQSPQSSMVSYSRDPQADQLKRNYMPDYDLSGYLS